MYIALYIYCIGIIIYLKRLFDYCLFIYIEINLVIADVKKIFNSGKMLYLIKIEKWKM